MRKTTRKLKGCLIAAAALVGLAAIGLYELSENFCSTLPDSSTLSPDGTLKAVISTRSCSALDPFYTQVSVIAAADTLHNRTGSVFTCEPNAYKNSQIPTLRTGGPLVSVQWTGPHSLLIHSPAQATIDQRENLVPVKTGWFHTETVNITYTITPPLP